jgi:hypothetical protein
VKKDVYDLPHHPAAALFPMMCEAELRELAEDIKKNGQMEPIILCHGKVIDGRNRLAACKLAGLEPYIGEKGVDGSRKVAAYSGEQLDPTDYVLSLNLHRRHLTAQQKRDVIAAILKANPGRSNRQVAEQVKADHKTVGKVRERLRSTGEIPQLEETEGKDGKARPARNGAAEVKRQREKREEEQAPELRQYVWDSTGSIEVMTEKLKTVPPEGWEMFNKENPRFLARLLAACESLTELVRTADQQRSSKASRGA